MVASRPLVERFHEKYIPEPNSGCWLWDAACDTGGYAQISVGNKSKSAHRISYEMHVGPVPEGLVLDHKCRVRSCVNPDHLEPVTNRENILRGDLWKVHGLKTHCPKGHSYSQENSYLYRGSRHCKKCKIINQMRRRRVKADVRRKDRVLI